MGKICLHIKLNEVNFLSKKKYNPPKENLSDDLELSLLKTTSNTHELNLMKNLLDEHNIPYIVKDHGAGGYMRIISGSSLYGADILVEKATFEKAKSILDRFIWNE